MINSNNVLDEKWYSEILKSGSFETYEYLDGNPEIREKEKDDFLAKIKDNPDLDYPKLIDEEELKNKEESLLQLKQRIIKEEENPLVKKVYIWKLNEKIAEIRLLKTTKNLAKTKSKKMARKFSRYNNFIYLKPTQEVFDYTLGNLKKEIDEGYEMQNEDGKNVIVELRKLINFSNIPNNISINLPNEDMVLFMKKYTERRLGKLIEIVNPQKEYSASDIKKIFEDSLLVAGAQGWEIAFDESANTGISTDHEKKQVLIPLTRKVKHKKMLQLIAHEIGTHVVRRENGELSQLKLLGLGLDRYLKGEDGLATVREDAIEEKVVDFAGKEAYLAIGMAMGLDGQKRDFRQLFEVLTVYFTWISLKIKNKKNKEYNINEIKTESEIKAWKRCIRTFRGTSCNIPGICFTKDALYRPGNIDIWKIIENNPMEVEQFQVGKYDPANQRHLEILNQLGI